MILVDMLNEQPCTIISRAFDGTGNKMDILGQFINKDKNGIMTRRGSRETGDKVHRNGVPPGIGNGQRSEQTKRSLIDSLVGLTREARLNI